MGNLYLINILIYLATGKLMNCWNITSDNDVYNNGNANRIFCLYKLSSITTIGRAHRFYTPHDRFVVTKPDEFSSSSSSNFSSGSYAH